MSGTEAPINRKWLTAQRPPMCLVMLLVLAAGENKDLGMSKKYCENKLLSGVNYFRNIIMFSKSERKSCGFLSCAGLYLEVCGTKVWRMNDITTFFLISPNYRVFKVKKHEFFVCLLDLKQHRFFAVIVTTVSICNSSPWHPIFGLILTKICILLCILSCSSEWVAREWSPYAWQSGISFACSIKEEK